MTFLERKVNVMLKPVPKMCITCRNYDPIWYRCKAEKRYIGYLESGEKTKCKSYSLSDHYRRGGKWYESRKEKNDAPQD